MSLTQILRRRATVIHELAAAVAYGEILPLDLAADIGLLQIDGGDAFAAGVYTLTANPANNDDVTIGLIVKTWKTALSVPGVPDEVLIGAAATNSLDNLIASFNRDDGEGTLYSAGQVSPDVICSAGAGDTMDADARVAGTGPNAVDTTENGGNSSWGAATLVGGTAFVATVDFEATLDGLSFFPLQGTPIDGTAGVLLATAVGAWRFEVAGLLGLRFPLSAWTSGAPTARLIVGAKTQG